MNITINGEDIELSAQKEHSVAAALSLFLTEKQSESTFAVAVNGDFVARDTYAVTLLQANDSIDVLFPIVGG